MINFWRVAALLIQSAPQHHALPPAMTPCACARDSTFQAPPLAVSNTMDPFETQQARVMRSATSARPRKRHDVYLSARKFEVQNAEFREGSHGAACVCRCAGLRGRGMASGSHRVPEFGPRGQQNETADALLSVLSALVLFR